MAPPKSRGQKPNPADRTITGGSRQQDVWQLLGSLSPDALLARIPLRTGSREWTRLIHFCTMVDEAVQRNRIESRGIDLPQFNGRGSGRTHWKRVPIQMIKDPQLFVTKSLIEYSIRNPVKAFSALATGNEHTGEIAVRLVAATNHFFNGLLDGLSSSLSNLDSSRLRQKVQQSITLPTVFNTFLLAGTAHGIAIDAVNSLKSIVNLVLNLEEIIVQVLTFMEEILSDPEMAYDLGQQMAIGLSASIAAMINSDIYQFSYKLGKTFGPFIVGSLLALFGFWGLAFSHSFKWLRLFLKRHPRLNRSIKEIAQILPSKTGFVHFGRATTAFRRGPDGPGMPRAHFDQFRAAAQKEQVIAIVRNTNHKSIDLIELHKCPPKPKNLEGIAKSSPDTGIVMVKNGLNENAVKIKRRGFFIVDPKGIPRDLHGNPMDVSQHKHFWKPKPGQVVDPGTGKPIVGDYDLMGILDPKSPGSNVALATKNGEAMANVTSPIVDRFQNSVNGLLGNKRVLHGAADQYGHFDGPCTVFYPDGMVTYLDTEAKVMAFYSSPDIRRQTRTGSYATSTTAITQEQGLIHDIDPIVPHGSKAHKERLRKTDENAGR